MGRTIEENKNCFSSQRNSFDFVRNWLASLQDQCENCLDTKGLTDATNHCLSCKYRKGIGKQYYPNGIFHLCENTRTGHANPTTKVFTLFRHSGKAGGDHYAMECWTTQLTFHNVGKIVTTSTIEFMMSA